MHNLLEKVNVLFQKLRCYNDIENMRFFELHFNPQKGESPESIFDSFCYEPQNLSEKRLGHLFLVGELKNVLSVNLKLLDNLANQLKKHYYSSPLKSSAEASLKASLKKTNEFLEQLAKQGEVHWLGNLSMGICSVAPSQKNSFLVNFAKVGNVKILLLRSGQIIDVGKNLEFSEIEPYPLKIFGNIVSGKLYQEDTVAVLSKEVFDFFSEKGILKEMANSPLSELTLKKILKNKDKDLRGLSGIFLLCLLENGQPNKEPRSSLIFQKLPEKFSLSKVFLPVVNTFNANLKIRRIKRRWRDIKENLQALNRKRNLIVLLLLLFLLLLGFLLF